MDSHSQENPGECSVCFTTFDESEHRPRTLPCGHTFCSPCIGDMMEGGQLSCPICRICHPTTSVTQLPINYIAEAFVKHLKAMKLTQTPTVQEASRETPLSVATGATVTTAGATCQKTKVISRKLRSLLEEKKSSVSSVMAGSQKVQSQLDQYRAQLADWKTQHLHLLDRLYDLVQQNQSVLELMEQEDARVLNMKIEGEEGEKQLEAVLGYLQAVNTAEEVFTTINHADRFTVEAEDWIHDCQEIFPDVNTIKTTMKVREITRTALELVATKIDEGEGARRTLETEGAAEANFHLVYPHLLIMEKVQYFTSQGEIKVEDLRMMRSPIKRLVEAGSVFGVQEDQGGLRLHSSRITLENGQLYLHCLLDQPPPLHAHTLLVNEMVESLDHSSTLVFLDLSWPGSTKGRVHIRLSPDTSLARQFILLCTGECGHSYINTILLSVWDKGQPKEYVVGGDYEHNTGEGGAPLLPHPYHQYRESGRAGAVLSWYWAGSNISAQFGITTKEQENGEEWPDVIGEVESGLEVVRAAVNHCDIEQVTVVDCGIVIPL